ncbi:Hypothetical predicted protein [Lecanosticta acicola]|uniref:Uncharacterized protein n=1 Tax=Lecanosticta acicola TaxID=111012 RepID=A0AAI8YW32_9PEZI|nr:Hypothetical predicted protein [Lecanosticta acicola]
MNTAMQRPTFAAIELPLRDYFLGCILCEKEAQILITATLRSSDGGHEFLPGSQVVIHQLTEAHGNVGVVEVVHGLKLRKQPITVPIQVVYANTSPAQVFETTGLHALTWNKEEDSAAGAEERQKKGPITFDRLGTTVDTYLAAARSHDQKASLRVTKSFPSTYGEFEICKGVVLGIDEFCLITGTVKLLYEARENGFGGGEKYFAFRLGANAVETHTRPMKTWLLKKREEWIGEDDSKVGGDARVIVDLTDESFSFTEIKSTTPTVVQDTTHVKVAHISDPN